MISAHKSIALLGNLARANTAVRVVRPDAAEWAVKNLDRQMKSDKTYTILRRARIGYWKPSLKHSQIYNWKREQGCAEEGARKRDFMLKSFRG